jgi:dTDP-4-dehydrorhamnose reductase
MNILIAGANGLLGKALFTKLSKLGFKVYRINRFTKEKEDVFYEYHTQNPSIPLVKFECDVFINCAYCYEDKRLDDSNVNFAINRNLISFSKKNNIPIFINISTMSAFDGCLSLYGNIKLLIEKEVSLIKGYSFRLGLFEDECPVGLIKMLININKFIPFFSLGVNKKNLLQYLTNIDKLSKFICFFLNNIDRYKPEIYSLVNSAPLDFNEIIYATTQKPTIKIPVPLLKTVLFAYELLPLPKLRFNLDSLAGLTNLSRNPRNLIKLEEF